MYDACDDSGNYYLIMDSIVDYWNNDKAITFTDQKVFLKGWRFMWQFTVGCQL